MVASGIGGVIAGLVARRIAVSGVQSYGSDGAQYIEHFERMRALAMVRGSGAWNPVQILVEADGTFPPLLHLITLGVGAVVGHGVDAAAAQSLGWLLLLGLATASACRSLGGRADVAFVAVLLFPAFHGAAVRYYYDLPMTAALWVCVALFVAGGWRRAAIAGVVAAGAALMKWAAVLFGAPLILGAVVAQGGCRRERAAGLVIATAVAGALCGAFLIGSGPDNSFALQAQVTFGDTPPAMAVTDEEVSALVAGRLGERLGDAGWRGLVFYPLRLVTSLLSPLGFGVLLALLIAGRRALRPVLPLALVVAVGHGLLLLLVVPVWDDRFLVPGLPALAVAAGLAMTQVDVKRWTAGCVAVGLLVAAEFHLAGEGPWSAEVSVLDGAGEHLPRTSARGLFAAGSEERRGWSPVSDDRPVRRAFRDAIWAGIERCGSEAPAVLSERPLIDSDGDQVWFQVRALEAEVLRGGGRVQPETLCTPDAPAPPSLSDGRLDLLITSRSSGLALPGCVEPSRWEAAAAVDDPDGGAGAILWRRRGEPPCPDR
jgi:hypothetical protein